MNGHGRTLMRVAGPGDGDGDGDGGDGGVTWIEVAGSPCQSLKEEQVCAFGLVHDS